MTVLLHAVFKVVLFCCHTFLSVIITLPEALLQPFFCGLCKFFFHVCWLEPMSLHEALYSWKQVVISCYVCTDLQVLQSRYMIFNSWDVCENHWTGLFWYCVSCIGNCSIEAVKTIIPDSWYYRQALGLHRFRTAAWHLKMKYNILKSPLHLLCNLLHMSCHMWIHYVPGRWSEVGWREYPFLISWYVSIITVI